jgi:hypothetical protein
LGAIAGVTLKSERVKPSDKVAAMNLMARINGWLAPEKFSGNVSVGDKRDATDWTREELLAVLNATGDKARGDDN